MPLSSWPCWYFCVFTLYPGYQRRGDELSESISPFGSAVYHRAEKLCGQLQKRTFLQGGQKHAWCIPSLLCRCLLLMAFSIAIMILPFPQKACSQCSSPSTTCRASPRAWRCRWCGCGLYDSSPDGLFNQVLSFLHAAHAELAFLQQNVHAVADVDGADVRARGANIIIYIAALLGIDNSYFEAAGAGRRHLLCRRCAISCSRSSSPPRCSCW